MIGLGRLAQGVAIPVSPSTSDAGVAAARLGRHDEETVAVRSSGSKMQAAVLLISLIEATSTVAVIQSFRMGKGKAGMCYREREGRYSEGMSERRG